MHRAELLLRVSVFQLPGALSRSPGSPGTCSFRSGWVAVCGLRRGGHRWDLAEQELRGEILTAGVAKTSRIKWGWFLNEVSSCFSIPGEVGTASEDDFLSHSWKDNERCRCHPQLRDRIQARSGEKAPDTCAYLSTNFSWRPPQNVFLEFREFRRQGLIFFVTILASGRQCSIRGNRILESEEIQTGLWFYQWASCIIFGKLGVLSLPSLWMRTISTFSQEYIKLK